MRWHNWTIIVLALWVLVSPWLLGFSDITLAVWSNVIASVFIALLALWNLERPEEQ